MTTIIDACRAPALFAPWFKERSSWSAWFAFLAALFALPMTPEELALYQRCTGRTHPPSVPAQEAWLVVGRRGGKSFIVALVAVFLACFRDYRAHLSPGERGVVMITAADRKQARVIFRYVRALLEGVPMLARLIERMDSDSLDLSNGISIEIHTASIRSTRGYTVVAYIGDEIALWRSDESANPDTEILNAVRPAMATIPGALLLGISSPYARRGAMWEAFRDHYGHDGDPVLVWRADTRTMNPSVPEDFITTAYARDPASAAAEFGAEFRTDIAAFLNSDWLDSATRSDAHDLPPQADVSYHGFADPSGGGSDAFTLGIAHHELTTGRVVLDCLRARRPPFSPESVVIEYAALLRNYGLHSTTGDHYAAGWVVESFANAGISYQHSERNKSEIYLEAEPLFAQGRVQLPDDRALLTELRQLERRTARGGKDSVDHPPRGHDDLSNAACGALVLASKGAGINMADIAACVAINNEIPTSSSLIGAVGSILGSSDLERLQEQRRADHAINTGADHAAVDWLNELL
jgi:hypothetical protein